MSGAHACCALCADTGAGPKKRQQAAATNTVFVASFIGPPVLLDETKRRKYTEQIDFKSPSFSAAASTRARATRQQSRKAAMRMRQRRRNIAMGPHRRVQKSRSETRRSYKR